MLYIEKWKESQWKKKKKNEETEAVGEDGLLDNKHEKGNISKAGEGGGREEEEEKDED